VPDRNDNGIDQELARLAAATNDLEPDHSFSDAVLRAAGEADPLARIARATRDLEPDAAFTSAVLEAVRAAPARPAIGEGIVRTGRFAIGAAALAAAASVLLFFQTQRQVDEAIMASVDTVEVSE
jgi:hypothetical protein